MDGGMSKWARRKQERRGQSVEGREDRRNAVEEEVEMGEWLMVGRS